MKIIGIIPARYASTRFPGKPLANIGDKTMVHRVYEQAMKSETLNEVIVATDDDRIFKEVESFGGKVMMTSPSHQNGTERCAEVAQKLNADVIINIQGDEPFIHPGQIDLVANAFKVKSDVPAIATLIKEHPYNHELLKSSRVKAIINNKLDALYFSRTLIPFSFDSSKASSAKYYVHLGLYGFKKEVLLELVKLPPSSLELAENLEQLRWLQNGYTIKCAITTLESRGIDTPEDLQGLSFPA
jgi:3-deoxy-manno-octulosonate cytidylyltransferase (CMP-KDO synthetase)